MAPILIVVGLLALGVAIVAFATRRPAGTRPQGDRDTGRSDPILPAEAAVDPFAHAPMMEPVAGPAPPGPASPETQTVLLTERQA